MPEFQPVAAAIDSHDEHAYTLHEIFQQPVLWPTTVARVRAASAKLHPAFEKARVLLTGAGRFSLRRGRRSFRLATGCCRSYHRSTH